MVNVGKYIIHGSYGLLLFQWNVASRNPHGGLHEVNTKKWEKVHQGDDMEGAAYHLHVVFFELWWIDYGWIL